CPGPRQDLDGASLLEGPGDHPVACVTDTRVAGVRADSHRLPGLEKTENPRAGLRLVLLPVGDDRFRTVNAVFLEKDPRVPGILTGQDVQLSEHPYGPQGHVLQVPDRRCNDEKLRHGIIPREYISFSLIGAERRQYL